MKEVLKKAAGTILFLFGLFLTVVSIATIFKVLEAGKRGKLDVEFLIVMAVFTVISTGICAAGSRLLGGYISKNISRIKRIFNVLFNAKTRIYIPLVISVICILLLFVFKDDLVVKMIFVLIGNFSMIAFGAYRGRKLQREGKIKRYKYLKSVIGLPVSLYWLIVYLLLEFVIGW